MKTINELTEMMRETKNQIIIFSDTVETFKQLGIPDLVLDRCSEKITQLRRAYSQLVTQFNQAFPTDGEKR